MCGVLGLIAIDKMITRNQFQCVNDSMILRGPDAGDTVFLREKNNMD